MFHHHRHGVARRIERAHSPRRARGRAVPRAGPRWRSRPGAFGGGDVAHLAGAGLAGDRGRPRPSRGCRRRCRAGRCSPATWPRWIRRDARAQGRGRRVGHWAGTPSIERTSRSVRSRGPVASRAVITASCRGEVSTKPCPMEALSVSPTTQSSPRLRRFHCIVGASPSRDARERQVVAHAAAQPHAPWPRSPRCRRAAPVRRSRRRSFGRWPRSGRPPVPPAASNGSAGRRARYGRCS
jgi:hypothetical protein